MSDDYVQEKIARDHFGIPDDPELTDEQVTAYIDDPSKIPTHETALQVLECLDAEIAAITGQIDACESLWVGREMPDATKDWLQRATKARAWKFGHRHNVYRRDKELRGLKRQEDRTARKSPEEGLLKQARLKAEADARKLKRETDNLLAQAKMQEAINMTKALKQQATFNFRFQAAAQALLSPEEYARIKDAANKVLEG